MLYSILTLSLLLLVVDQCYQRFSHRWTGEPPLLPYRIPIIGHALQFGNQKVLFKLAKEHFGDSRPYSLMLFGKRVYVITSNKDISTVHRKATSLAFLPLVTQLSGLAWDISKDGMDTLSRSSTTGSLSDYERRSGAAEDSIFGTAHAFYRDGMKPGPALDELTLSFLSQLNSELDIFEFNSGSGSGTHGEREIDLFEWSRTTLATASSNALLGPTLLRQNPGLLNSVWLSDAGFFFFVNRVPRVFARKWYEARDRVVDALAKYFEDGGKREGGSAMIWDREEEMRKRGMSTRDIAAYSFSAWAVLLVNAIPMAYHLLRHVYADKEGLDRIREEIAPAFSLNSSSDSQTITTLSQVTHLTSHSPLLRAYFNETLRLHSSASSNRYVVQDVVVGDSMLKAGRNVICPSYVQHSTPEYFGGEVHQFNPSRFLTSSGVGVADKGEASGQVDADAKYLRSFGGGVALCSGRHFASNEVLSYVASVVWRYDFVRRGKGRVGIVKRGA